jgi:hypothetical protein
MNEGAVLVFVCTKHLLQLCVTLHLEKRLLIHGEKKFIFSFAASV